jgi:hypothetical protein
MEKTTVEEEYQLYLKAMKIPEDKMSVVERIERKRAFYAGITIGMKIVIDSAPSEDPTEEDFQQFSGYMHEIKQEIRDFAERSVKEQDELIKDLLN